MTKNDLIAVCKLLDPTADWANKNLTHVGELSIALSQSTSRQLLIDTIQSDAWPAAAPATIIAKNPEDQKKRATAIITSYFGNTIEGKKILDFGCGIGTCVDIATQMGATALGYDLAEHQEWVTQQGYYTTDFEKVMSSGPYDAIIIYDVIDHMIGSRIEVLNQLRDALTPKGQIFVRCHPYTSRHGTHLYNTYNKAYAHLFLTDDELREVGAGEQQRVFANLNPTAFYKALFRRYSYTIVKAKPTPVKPELLIKAFLPLISDRWHEYNINDLDYIANDIMSIQFIDYVLTR